LTLGLFPGNDLEICSPGRSPSPLKSVKSERFLKFVELATAGWRSDNDPFWVGFLRGKVK
jgi:hypothetical protein